MCFMAGAKLIELMRKQAEQVVPKGMELGVVIKPLPNLIIKINNMDKNLTKHFLVIPERLNDVLTFEVGDIIAITPFDGGNKYLIIDKVVDLNE